jgi:hypothetical protein
VLLLLLGLLLPGRRPVLCHCHCRQLLLQALDSYYAAAGVTHPAAAAAGVVVGRAACLLSS